MRNKKLTDEDVVEGLERCISPTTNKACAGCPFNKQNLCDIDQWALEKYALNLINRQRAEIERLKSANDEKFCQWDMLAEKTKQHYADLYNEAKDILKSEAYKEFAEKLKKRYDNPVWYLGGSNGFFDNLDNFVKEMVDE
jgi:hypothetical protein